MYVLRSTTRSAFVGFVMIKVVVYTNCPKIDNKKKFEKEGDFHLNFNHKFLI
jgi:hypothetical protein